MRDTGWKALVRENKYNFLKWGEYMKRAQLAERKVEVLKRILLLTHPSVSDVEMNSLTQRQWMAYISEFQDERMP